MNIQEMIERLVRVRDIYVNKFDIRTDDDWYVLKLQEELGELTSAHLKLTQRARTGEESKESLQKNLKDEIADVIAMALLFAQHKEIDVEQAVKDKWFRYL